MSDVLLFNIHHDCTTLSPVRSSVFYAEGCRFRCKGCLYWEGHGNLGIFRMDVHDAAESVLKNRAECLVLSGGDPLLQAGPFLEMVRELKKTADIGLIIYCGETQEELEAMKAEDEDVRGLLGYADVIISGRYIQELDSDNPMVGSTNQCVEFVTDRYREYTHLYASGERRIEIELSCSDDHPHISYSGVPTASQRRFFDGLTAAIADGVRPDCTERASLFSLTDDTGVFALGGETLAYVKIEDGRIRLTVRPLTDRQMSPLINAFIDLKEE